jgi:glycosyltransferase involved in cell wall biosynthesis
MVEILCIGHTTGLKKIEKINGVTVKRLNESKNYTNPKIKKLKRDWIAIIKYSILLRKYLKQNSFDYLILNQWPILHCFFIPRKFRSKCFLDWCESRSSWIFKLIQKILSSTFDMNSAVSESVAKNINYKKRNSFVIFPSASNMNNFDNELCLKKNSICMISRLEEHKNIFMGIEIFRRINAYDKEASLDIIGDGSVKHEIKKLIDDNGLKNIHLHGYLSDVEKNNILKSSKVLLITSFREGHPVTLSESVFFKTPILTIDYKDNGAADIVSKYRIGEVVESKISNNIAEKSLEKYLNIINNYDGFQENCIEASKSFDPILNSENYKR